MLQPFQNYSVGGSSSRGGDGGVHQWLIQLFIIWRSHHCTAIHFITTLSSISSSSSLAANWMWRWKADNKMALFHTEYKTPRWAIWANSGKFWQILANRGKWFRRTSWIFSGAAHLPPVYGSRGTAGGDYTDYASLQPLLSSPRRWRSSCWWLQRLIISDHDD